jgi:hypothetical protein
MFWLSAISALGVIACIIIHLFQKHPDYHLTAAEVEKIEREVRA